MGGGLNQFSKRGVLAGPHLLEGVCWEKGDDFIQGGCNFHIKLNQNLKYLTSKKVYEQKYFSLS